MAKRMTAKEKALWGEPPYAHDDGTPWHRDASRWYESLRTMEREWTEPEVAHAQSLADDISMYKLTFPRNAAAMKVIYTEMEKFFTTPKAIAEVEANKPKEEDTFTPSPELVGSFMGQMRFGAKSVEEYRND